ncbi:MAG: hypothetical protein ACLP8S_05735 [Solirubrobacteraceae bacterium]
MSAAIIAPAGLADVRVGGPLADGRVEHQTIAPLLRSVEDFCLASADPYEQSSARMARRAASRPSEAVGGRRLVPFDGSRLELAAFLVDLLSHRGLGFHSGPSNANSRQVLHIRKGLNGRIAAARRLR